MEKEQKKEFKELLKEILDTVLDEGKFDPVKLRSLSEEYKNYPDGENEIKNLGLSSIDVSRIQAITDNCLNCPKYVTRKLLLEGNSNPVNGNFEDRLKETRKKL